MNFTTFQIKRLINSQYLFNPFPGTDFGFYWFFVISYGVLFVLAAVFSVLASRFRKENPIRKAIKKSTDLFFTISIVGYILLFFRRENIAYLSARVLFIVFSITMVIWAGFVIYYLIRKFPKSVKKYREKLRKEKYLK